MVTMPGWYCNHSVGQSYTDNQGIQKSIVPQCFEGESPCQEYSCHYVFPLDKFQGSAPLNPGLSEIRGLCWP